MRAADLEIGDCHLSWGESADQARVDCPRWSLEAPVGERSEQVGLPPWDGGGGTTLELRPLDTIGALRAAAILAGRSAEELLATLPPEAFAAPTPLPRAPTTAYPSGVVERGTDHHRLHFVHDRLVAADVQLASLPAHPGERIDLPWTDPWSPVVASVRGLRQRAASDLHADAIDAATGRIEREIWKRAPGATLLVLERRPAGEVTATPGGGVTLWERRRPPFAELAERGAAAALDAFAVPLAEWLERRHASRVDGDLVSELAAALAVVGFDVALDQPRTPPPAGTVRVERIEFSGTGRWRGGGDLVATPDLLVCLLSFVDADGPANGAFAFDRTADAREVAVLLEITPKLLRQVLGRAAPNGGVPAGNEFAELAVDFWAGSWETASPRLPGGPLFAAAWLSRDAASSAEAIRWALLRPDVGRAGTLLANGSQPTLAEGRTAFHLAAVPDGFDLTLRSDRFDPKADSTRRCHAVRWRGEVEERSCDEAMRSELRWDLPDTYPKLGLYRGRIGDEPVVGCYEGPKLELYRERDGRTVILFEDQRAYLRFNEVEPGEMPPDPLCGERFWLLEPADPSSTREGERFSEIRGVRRGAKAVDLRFELQHVAADCAPGFEAQRVDRPRLSGERRSENGVEAEENEHPITGLPSFTLVSGIPDESRRRINGALAERARWLDAQFFACSEWDGEVVPRFLSREWVVAEAWGNGSCRFGEPLARREQLMFDARSGEPIGLANWLRPECFEGGPRGELRDRVIERFGAGEDDSTCLERAVDNQFVLAGLWLEENGAHLLFDDTAPELEHCSAERTVPFDALRPCITAAALPTFDRFAAEAKRIATASRRPAQGGREEP